jgi:hypothetical protein
MFSHLNIHKVDSYHFIYVSHNVVKQKTTTKTNERGIIMSSIQRIVKLSAIALGLALSAAATAKTSVVTSNITQAEVLAAQQAWGDAIVNIGKTYDNKGAAEARELAADIIDKTYAYNLGPVLFKPTLAPLPVNIRTTEKGALSYFVGGDATFPSDSGFALKGWQQVKSDNTAIQLHGATAMTMGNVMFTDKAGQVTTVDKTWGYIKDDNGDIRIILHHSSLPYSAQ